MENTKLRISVFSTLSKEGLLFCKRVEDILPPHCDAVIWKEKRPGQIDMLLSCLRDDIILFDATREEQKQDGNCEAAILPLLHLDNVIIYSRNYLPVNFMGLRNNLSYFSGCFGAPAYSKNKDQKGGKYSENDILEWIKQQITDIATYCYPHSDDMQIQEESLNRITDEALILQALSSMILVKQSPEYTLNEYKQFILNINMFILNKMFFDALPEINNKDIKMLFHPAVTAICNILERLIAEVEIGFCLINFAENLKHLPNLYNEYQNHFGEIGHSIEELKFQLVSLYISGNIHSHLYQNKSKKINFFKTIFNTVPTSVEIEVQEAIEKVIKCNTPEGNFREVTRNKFKQRFIKEADIKNIVQHGLRYPPFYEIRNKIFAGNASGDGEASLIKQTGESVFFPMWNYYLKGVDAYQKKIKAKYSGFVSYRTNTFADAKKTANDENCLIIDPGEFSSANELFSLRRRFAFMKTLYSHIQMLDTFHMHISEKYLVSWWTIFELISFVNAKDNNIDHIFPKNVPEVALLEKFKLNEIEKYQFQRFLLYSNNSILSKDNAALVKLFSSFFSGDGSENGLISNWEKLSLQCIHSPVVGELLFEDIASLLGLVKPFHVFFKPEDINNERITLSCPGFIYKDCPKKRFPGKFNNSTACVFEITGCPRPRYIWQHDDIENSLIEEKIFHYKVIKE